MNIPKQKAEGRNLPVLLPAFCSLLFAFAPLAFAWGEKGHYIVNEAATLSLPTDMPHFFYKAFPELVWLAYDPDRWKGAGPSIDSINEPDHFLDYEYVADLELPRERYKYIDLLRKSGALRRQGITSATPGFLPWRIAELCELLTTEWRQWRASAPGSPERAMIERDIIHHAGILGHFAGDSSNPQHSTLNHNGWVLPNPHRYATDCETHSRFERNFISHAVATADVVPKVAPVPVLRTDYFSVATEMVRTSNSLVETLYQLDRDGGFDVFGPVSPRGFAFATDRLAAGASFLRDLWWSTWINSAKPPQRRRTSED